MPISISDARSAIRARALAEGFDAVGFCHAEAVPLAGARLRRFLALGRHGDMGWLAAKADRRESPRALWPEARSVVMVGLNYAPASDPMRRLRLRERGAISVYAQGSDYHDLVKRRLKRLGRWIGESLACELKVFVDTAPVPEKPLAAAAGLGWQGKHTNLVSRQFGSWLFLGAIYLATELPADAPEADHCGSCRNCLDVCPTAAFPAPYQLDARRCISYLTIEHAGTIPRGLRRAIGNRIYGCDDCLAVCPWNKFARPTGHEALRPRAEFDLPRLADLAELDDGGFRKLFAGTAIRRIGRDRLLRNVAIALGNSGEARAAAPLRKLLSDPAPGVRAMAVWALGQLLPRSEWEELRRRALPGEDDEGVREEWLA